VSEIDWDVELRKIEREYDGLPPTPSASRVRAERAAEQRKRERLDRLWAVAGAWLRIILVAALAAALAWWPYPRSCGLALGAFLASGATVALGGCWVAMHTWRHRVAGGHVMGILLLVAGLAVVAAESLPRTGYGTVRWAGGDRWACAAPAGVDPDAFLPAGS
jgi:hypothetical protein